MTEMEEGCALGEDGRMHERLAVSVYDPVARTSMNWQVGDDIQPKVVHVHHMPDLPARTATQPATRSQPAPEQLEQRQRTTEAAKAQQAKLRNETTTEELGVNQIAGVTAQGTRISRTIPAGQEGNDLPLVVINENWRSKELGLTVRTISDDPRRGRTTSEYEELNLGEPDPGLFVPPAGYTVEEQPQTGISGGGLLVMGALDQ
jgi:hypothetical protein